MKTLIIDDSSSDEDLARAAGLLEDCGGIVELAGVVTLSPGYFEIECTVRADPMLAVARCEEEYKVLVENAARALRSSRLGPLLPARPLRWVVIGDWGAAPVELWQGRW